MIQSETTLISVPVATNREPEAISGPGDVHLHSASLLRFENGNAPGHAGEPDYDSEARAANVFDQLIVAFKPNRRIQIRGIYGTREVVDFLTNSPNDLNGNKEIIQGAVDAMTSTGVVHASVAAARALTGMSDEICSVVADMKGGNSRARYYPTTFAANIAAAAGLARLNFTVVMHKNAHATLQSALGGAIPADRLIRVANPSEVAAAIAKSSRRPMAVVEDGTYSMGTFADFGSMQKFLDQSPSGMVLIDDAHSVGLRGKNGRGEAMERMVDYQDNCVVTGSFGKAVGGVGGFMVGPKRFVQQAIKASVSDRFSCNVDVAGQGATLASLRILARPGVLKHLQSELNIRLTRVDVALAAMGIKTEQANTPIPFRVIYFGSAEEAIAAAGVLLDQAGCMTTPVYHPTIARGRGAIRISISVGHSLSDLDQLLNTLASLINRRKAS